MSLGWKGKLVKSGSTAHASVFGPFQKVHIACFYECPPNGVNVFERGITLPGRSELSLAATTPCRLQLYTVLLTWKGKVRPRTGHEGPEGE